MATLALWLRPPDPGVGLGLVEPVGDELSAPLPVAFVPDPVVEALLLVDVEEDDEDDDEDDDEEDVDDGMTPIVVRTVGVAGRKVRTMPGHSKITDWTHLQSQSTGSRCCSWTRLSRY
jgi:hypothetical protein